MPIHNIINKFSSKINCSKYRYKCLTILLRHNAFILHNILESITHYIFNYLF